MTPEMTGAEALRLATSRLREAGVPDPARDARRLLAWSLDSTTDRLALALPEALGEGAPRFASAVAARAARQPVSQITGSRAFYGRDFAVDGTVLDPRPETELIVDLALDDPFERVLDLGTGTGCILLTLLAERPSAIGTGTDISADARALATGNAMALRVSDRAEIAPADWFSPRGGEGPSGRYDLIVSNPPYIAAAEMAGLAPEVRDWEPEGALTDGQDGLSAYRAIAEGAVSHLTPRGRLIVEIGPAQAAAVSALFEAGGLEDIRVHPDLDGRDRAVSARRRACG